MISFVLVPVCVIVLVIADLDLLLKTIFIQHLTALSLNSGTPSGSCFTFRESPSHSQCMLERVRQNITGWLAITMVFGPVTWAHCLRDVIRGIHLICQLFYWEWM